MGFTHTISLSEETNFSLLAVHFYNAATKWSKATNPKNSNEEKVWIKFHKKSNMHKYVSDKSVLWFNTRSIYKNSIFWGHFCLHKLTFGIWKFYSKSRYFEWIVNVSQLEPFLLSNMGFLDFQNIAKLLQSHKNNKESTLSIFHLLWKIQLYKSLRFLECEILGFVVKRSSPIL